MNRSDLQQLADVRISEASALLSLPVPMADGAYYLAGYAVECALKACITKQYNQYDWPDKQFVNRSHTHDLEELLRLAQLDAPLTADMAANPAIRQRWDIVKDWSEQSRYERHPLALAREMVDAVASPANGILPWIKARW